MLWVLWILVPQFGIILLMRRICEEVRMGLTSKPETYQAMSMLLLRTLTTTDATITYVSADATGGTDSYFRSNK